MCSSSCGAWASCPIETVATSGKAKRRRPPSSANGQTRQAVVNAIGELAVLLEAGLTLDRALAVCVDNIINPGVKAAFAKMHARVKEGAPLSRGHDRGEGPLSAHGVGDGEAGEADGRLGAGLARLAESLDRAEALRQTIVSSMVYPAMLIAVAHRRHPDDAAVRRAAVRGPVRGHRTASCP